MRVRRDDGPLLFLGGHHKGLTAAGQARSQHFPPKTLLPGLAAGHRAPSVASTSARSQQKKAEYPLTWTCLPSVLQKGASTDRRPLLKSELFRQFAFRSHQDSYGTAS